MDLYCNFPNCQHGTVFYICDKALQKGVKCLPLLQSPRLSKMLVGFQLLSFLSTEVKQLVSLPLVLDAKLW